MPSKNKKNAIYHIIGGGTVNHIRSHFALTATAYGHTARSMNDLFKAKGINTRLHLTKMACAGKSGLETNDDVSKLVDKILSDPASTVLVFNPAIADFEGQIGNIPSGKYAERLKSREAINAKINLKTADKIVPRIKQKRPDITLVAFKTTTHADKTEQYQRAQELLKSTKADFILANDTGTRLNMIIDSTGHILKKTKNREKALEFLITCLCQLADNTPPNPGQNPPGNTPPKPEI